MNSFGLGLVLNFVDNASSGMANATRTFQQMSATADAMSSTVSTSVTDLVTSSYALSAVGDTLQNTGASILSVYGSISQSVIDSGMQMQGYRSQLSALYGSVEAGEAKIQELKDYAMSSVFDLQSLIPAVTTMKAVGIEAMEEVATSSGKHTQKLLDYASDIAAMVPNMRNTYGTGVQAAMGSLKEYIAEGNALSLKRNAGLDIEGILGEGKGSTIEERTRQVADLVEKLGIVGYTASLAGTPTQRLSNMEDALFNSLTKIADSGVFEKYCSLLEKLSNWVFSLVDNEETFNIITGILADTVSTLLSPLEKLLDFVTKNGDAIVEWIKNHATLTKNILVTVAAIGAFLVVGGTLLKLLSSIGMAFAGLQFIKSLPTLLKGVGTQLGALVLKALPFVALAGVMYYAWRENLFGIRDALTKTFNQLGTIFSLVKDAWEDNTLSEESYQKALDLGILPLIEGLLQLKYYWDFLSQGFKDGFKSFIDGISEALSSLGILDGDVTSLVSSFGEFLKSLFEIGAEDKWTKIGENLGKIVGFVTTFLILATALKGVFTIVSGVVSVFSTVGSAIMSVLTAISGIVGISVGWVVVIIAAVVAIGVLIYKNWDKIKETLSKVGTWIYDHIILPVRNFFATALNFIVGLVVTIWEGIKSFITPIANWIYTNVIQPVIDFVRGLWNDVTRIWSAIGSWVYGNIIAPVVNFFTSLWSSIVGIATSIYNGICDVLSPIAEWVNTNIITPVVDFFTGLWTQVSEIFTGIYNSITGAFQDAYNTVVGVWQGITGFFEGIWNKVSGWASGIVNKGESITGVRSKVPAAATGVKNFVGGLIQVNEEGGELITLPSGSTVIPHDQSIKKSLEKGITIGASSLAAYASRPAPSSSRAETKNDYSVTFAPGSIVIQLANATEAELERAAEKLMKIIARKQQLRNMATRTV